MHFTSEKVTSKCDFLSLKQVYAHFCTALYMCKKRVLSIGGVKVTEMCPESILTCIKFVSTYVHFYSHLRNLRIGTRSRLHRGAPKVISSTALKICFAYDRTITPMYDCVSSNTSIILGKDYTNLLSFHTKVSHCMLDSAIRRRFITGTKVPSHCLEESPVTHFTWTS